MSEILNDLSEEVLTWAVEANLFESMLTLQLWPRVEFHDDSELIWSITDIPFFMFNNVLRARLAPEAVEPAIQAAILRSQSHQVPICWYVGPSTRPTDLGARLEEHGFSTDESQIGMAIDMRNMNKSLPVTPDLTIKQVENNGALLHWCQVATAGFEMPDFTIECFYEWFLSLGFGNRSPIRTYLGWLNGKAVATSALFLGAGVAGIYCVATLPQARRWGIGAAMTLRPLQDARQMGYRVGILQASQMGFPVYRKIGFKEYCRINLYIKNF